MSAEPLPLFDPEHEPTIKLAEQPLIVDRSTIEAYIDCPLSARLQGSVDLIASVGNEVHRAISEVIVAHIESSIGPGESMRAGELRNLLEMRGWDSRADVQHDVAKALKYSLHEIASIVKAIPPESILAFDGGDDMWVPYSEDVGAVALHTMPDSFEATALGPSDADVGMIVTGHGIQPGSKILKIDGDIFTLSKPALLESTLRAKLSTRQTRSLSGQLDYDFKFGNQTVRLTAEMDLLHSTKAVGLLRLWDWKSGHKVFREETIEDSFQFQVYAFLVLETYPDVDAVDVVVHNTRKNQTTAPVRFVREDIGRIRIRILQAIGMYLLNYRKPIEEVQAIPSREACRLCSMAAMCTVCDEDISEIVKKPESAVDKLYALTRMQEEIEKTLKRVLSDRMVKCNFGDIVSPSGNCYGYKKPKTTRPTISLYAIKMEDKAEGE